MRPLFLIIYVGLLLGATASGVDTVIPVLGIIEESLATSASQTELVISSFTVAVGVGQFVFGPLSDRFGRLPALYFGLGLFAAGSLLCMLAGHLETLLLGRALQGVGAAAGQIVGRAILRDVYSGRELARALATATGILGLFPTIMPVIGYLSAAAAGWRMAFVLVFAFAALLLAMTRLGMRETLAVPDPSALSPRHMRQATVEVFAHPQSRLFLILLTVSSLAMMGYIVSVQRVFAESFGVGGIVFPIIYSCQGVGVLVGQMLNRRLIHRIGTANTIILSLVMVCLNLAVALLLGIAGLLNEYLMAGVIFLFTMAFMIQVSNATSLIIDPHGRIAGFTASLAGALSFGGASLVGYFLAQLYDGQVVRMLVGMLVLSLIPLALALYWTVSTRRQAV